MRLIVLLALLGIVVSLGSALVSLTRPAADQRSATVRALTWRIGISIALFVFIMVAIRLGWIAPHGVGG